MKLTNFLEAKHISITNWFVCPDCKGEGGFYYQNGPDDWDQEMCEMCQGKGRVNRDHVEHLTKYGIYDDNEFTPINEARYHGLHHIVEFIKDTIDNERRVIYMQEDFHEIPVGQERAVTQDLERLYGEPRTVRGTVPANLPWWTVETKHMIYSIDIGHDDDKEFAHAPYGVNFGSEVKKKKKK